ncbi:MAG: tetratricopeptide repeat protein [Gammaproteobacteria bacterium]|nr:tetratricopeptide repeat protein [Gammaproteobacteria bacterium]
MKVLITVGLLFVCLTIDVPANAYCGSPLERNNFNRPLDYTDQIGEAENLRIVESYHFSPKVEGLLEGDTGPLPMDIDYVLRQIPNHYRALAAMMRFQIAYPRPADANYYTMDCYLERALAFTPTDPNLHMLYAVYAHKKKEYDKALKFYAEANRIGLNSMEYHYNLGLLYFDMKDYEKAREHAEKAYSQNYPLQGLRNKLKRAGKWVSPQQ